MLRNFAAAVFTVAAFVVMPGGLAANAQTAADWKPDTFALANGMQVVVLPDHRVPVVTHMLWYRVGSADEVKGKSGIAHFLEHLMFKATEQLKAGDYSKIVARNGGQDNAITSFDFTTYYFRIARDRLPQMMRMEADRMVHLKLSDAEVIPELSVVREERRQTVESSPAAVLDEMVYAKLYAGHPYAIPVIGHMNEMAKLTRADAVEWYRTWYGPENAILVVAGDVTAEELKPLAEQIYGAAPRRGDLKTRKWPEVKPLAANVTVTHSDPKVRQVSWSRTWLGVEIGSADTEALQVGIEILAGARTSRIYRQLNERGLAVKSYGYSMDTEARGVIGIGADPAPGVSVAEVEEVTARVTRRFLRDGPTEDELVRAKEAITASSILTRDNQMALAKWYGEQLIAGQSVGRIEGRDDRIRAVTAADVVRVMNKYLSANHVDAVLQPEAR